MAQTVLTALPGILPRGRMKWLIIPTVTGNGTLSQMSTTGSDVTAQVVDWSGWSKKTALVNTGAIGDRFIPNQAGDITPDACTITFKYDSAGGDISGVLHQDDTTNVAIADDGVGTGKYYDLWKGVVVANITTVRTSANSTVTMALVEFAIPLAPSYRVAYPTS